MDKSPFEFGLNSITSRFRSGDATAVEMVEYCLGRISDWDNKLNAFEYIEPTAIHLAEALDKLHNNGTWLGPLMGMPVGIKDIFTVRGMPTTNGSLYPSAHITGDQGPVVDQLQRSGCIILGKTKTVEFALGATGVNKARGTPRNVSDINRHLVPGGSSSGSAVATAAGMCAFALGSDTGGSVRIPACYNGLFGHKTTVGRWPTSGVFPLSPTLDTIGPLVRYAEDAALLHEVMTGEKVPESPSLSSLTLGIPTNYFFDDLDREVAEVTESAMDKLQKAGVKFRDIEVPEAQERETLFPAIVPPELISALKTEGFHAAKDNLDPVTRARAEVGLSVSAIKYLTAQKRRVELEAIATRRMEGLDAWLTPTCPHLPVPVDSLVDPEIHERALQASRNTQPSNLFGQCAVTIPVQTSSVLPAGIQLISAGNCDARLLAISKGIEQLLGRYVQPMP